jgi:hypothetical protein
LSIGLDYENLIKKIRDNVDDFNYHSELMFLSSTQMISDINQQIDKINLSLELYLERNWVLNSLIKSWFDQENFKAFGENFKDFGRLFFEMNDLMDILIFKTKSAKQQLFYDLIDLSLNVINNESKKQLFSSRDIFKILEFFKEIQNNNKIDQIQGFKSRCFLNFLLVEDKNDFKQIKDLICILDEHNENSILEIINKIFESKKLPIYNEISNNDFRFESCRQIKNENIIHQ